MSEVVKGASVSFFVPPTVQYSSSFMFFAPVSFTLRPVSGSSPVFAIRILCV